MDVSKDDLDVPFKTYHKMSEVEEYADVIIDFSHHSTIDDVLVICYKNKNSYSNRYYWF